MTNRRRAILTAVSAIGLALAGALVWMGSHAVAVELRLRGGASTVRAQVTDARITKSVRSGPHYELKYTFVLSGSTTVYTRTDETGRAGLWSSLQSREVWEQARAAGTLQVVYLPDDPSVNRPLQAGAAPLGDPAAGLVLGLVLAAICLAVLVKQARS